MVHDDLYLFDHYLQHTCHAPGLTGNHSYARNIGLPKMATTNQGLLCTLLALGAACLCVDILQGYDPSTHMDHVDLLISKGDHYHGVALNALRSQLASGLAQDLETAHAHSAVLFGYAPARRRVFRLLHRHQRKLGFEPEQFEADSPSNLEWLQLLKGVRTIGRAYGPNSPVIESTYSGDLALPDSCVVAHILQAVKSQNSIIDAEAQLGASPTPVPRHALTPLVASTIHPAMDTLHARLDDFYKRFRTQHSISNASSLAFTSEHAEVEFDILQSLAASRSALSMLEALGNAVFGPAGQPPSPSDTAAPISTKQSPSSTAATLKGSQSSWLKAYCGSPPTFTPSQPLAHGMLTWASRVSAPFVSLLMAPLPLVPAATPDSPSVSFPLDVEIRMLAWDVYAHWAALTILIEHEAWWWADLGRSDIGQLEGLISPSSRTINAGAADSDWWPSQMRRAAEQLAVSGCY